MKHFLAFQKRKGLFIESSSINNNNSNLTHQFNHELMKYGYVLSKELFDVISTLDKTNIQFVYNDLLTGIKSVVGSGGYEAIYRNFPQSVLALSYSEFAINAIIHYWSFGTWRPEDEGYLKREFAIESVNYKTIKLIDKSQFDSIFTDILYSGNSISTFDKVVVDYFIGEGVYFDFNKISFKETQAYIGKRLLNIEDIKLLPIKDATTLLRVYSAYCGGDEGLKENTVFKNPSSRQVRLLSNTLDNCYNLEEAFKIDREKWLRLLFFLNPLTERNMKLRPNLGKYAFLLRNNPKELRTFNSRVEELLGKKDVQVLELLKKRPKAFMRRLDHTVRIFGMDAISKWLETNPDLSSSVSTYNHFTDRDKKQDGRGAVLAGQGASNVVTYDAQEPLDTKLVSNIKNILLNKIQTTKNNELKEKKVFIDRALYYRPLAINNRASSLSLDGKANGSVEIVPEGNTVRMYVHWTDRHDIDLSALMLTTDNEFTKVGWDSYHQNGGVVYSGDNTGYGPKNAEYMDITPSNLPKNAEWIILEARIYRGPNNFAGFTECRTGWMLREEPESNELWLPETIDHSILLNNKAKTAFAMAFHAPTRSIVYLDLAMGANQVSGKEDAVKMKMYLESFVTLDDGSDLIKWDKLNQGHVLHSISNNIVDKPEDADLVFDENTTYETICRYL